MAMSTAHVMAPFWIASFFITPFWMALFLLSFCESSS